MAKKDRERKKLAQARKRRGEGDDLFYSKTYRASLKPNDIIDVKIHEMDSDGIGIVRIGVLKIHVPGSKLGDNLKIEIQNIRGKSADANII